jgi:hypothetical protein
MCGEEAIPFMDNQGNAILDNTIRDKQLNTFIQIFMDCKQYIQKLKDSYHVRIAHAKYKNFNVSNKTYAVNMTYQYIVQYMFSLIKFLE